MYQRPPELLDREREWEALSRFVDRRQRLAIVYGPRRSGKSFLLDALCTAVGGHRYQALTGVAHAQLDDFGRTLGRWLGAGVLRLDGWSDALDRLARIAAPVVVLDELPYLTESSPELVGALQRYVDGTGGPALILAGSALSTMTDLVAPRAPLFGRAAAVVVPRPFAGRDLALLWDRPRPNAVLWVDAALGGLPGYRPLLEPPGASLDPWMTREVLAASSPLLDAAEASLAEVATPGIRGLYLTVLSAIAAGEQTFSRIARASGRPTSALSRPLAALERAGLIDRVADVLRARRDRYTLADPHLRLWLALIAPNRSALLAGRVQEVWSRVGDTVWPSQVLGPRWEEVARAHVMTVDHLGPVDAVGYTTVADRAARVNHEVDIVAVRGRGVVAVGEAKLRRLGARDVERLRRVRELLDAPDATLVLASATGVDATGPDLVAVTPVANYS